MSVTAFRQGIERFSLTWSNQASKLSRSDASLSGGRM
jgi:hypothetical protein